jgi:hypothetical protein
MLMQLAALVLFDVGCAARLVVGGDSKKRGPGYWCAFTAALLRAVISLMHALQAKPTQAERDEENGVKALAHPARDGHAYLPIAQGGNKSTPGAKVTATLEQRKGVREQEAARVKSQEDAIALAKKQQGASVAFTVALQEHTVASFGAGPQRAYCAATALALGVATAQVTITSVAAGSVIAETKVSGLADTSVAQEVAKKVADPSPAGLAKGLAKAGLGAAAVSEPIVLEAPPPKKAATAAPAGKRKDKEAANALSAKGEGMDSDSDLSDSDDDDDDDDVGKGLIKKAAAAGSDGSSDESSDESSDGSSDESARPVAKVS